MSFNKLYKSNILPVLPISVSERIARENCKCLQQNQFELILLQALAICFAIFFLRCKEIA
jgi:hypothetical protein